jgi:hypothetical protein
MKREIEITSDLGTEDDPLKVSIDHLGIRIETDDTLGHHVTLTPQQFEAVVAEMERYRRAVQVLAEPPVLPLTQAAE